MDDAKLLERVRVIEARQAGLTPTDSPTLAREAAAALCTMLSEARTRERDATHKVTLPDPWRRVLFTALCRRYGLHLHRHARQQRQTMMVCAPPTFFTRVLWREFEAISSALLDRFDAITERVVHELVPVGDNAGHVVTDGYLGAERDP
jgi:hypothetical protein